MRLPPKVGGTPGIFDRLFPERAAKRALNSAAVESMRRKLESGDALTELEQFFFETLYEKELRRHARLIATGQLAQDILDDPHERKKLPQPQPGGSPESPQRWWDRIARDIEDASDEAVQGLYARILAGEVSAPGSFSMKTLSVIRDLDRPTAELFALFGALAFDNGAIPRLTENRWREFYGRRNMSFADLLHLVDVGLVHPRESVVVKPDDHGGPNAFEGRFEYHGRNFHTTADEVD